MPGTQPEARARSLVNAGTGGAAGALGSACNANSWAGLRLQRCGVHLQAPHAAREAEAFVGTEAIVGSVAAWSSSPSRFASLGALGERFLVSGCIDLCPSCDVALPPVPHALEAKEVRLPPHPRSCVDLVWLQDFLRQYQGTRHAAIELVGRPLVATLIQDRAGRSSPIVAAFAKRFITPVCQHHAQCPRQVFGAPRARPALRILFQEKQDELLDGTRDCAVRREPHATLQCVADDCLHVPLALGTRKWRRG
mmetsp:Transcript_117434/g.327104  ORF Transcript_117434/g.327104 Transcript_117434/m.327104 type:complete len:252 (-) Transcript_117434:272-1027(-)